PPARRTAHGPASAGVVFAIALAVRLLYLVQIHAAGIGSYLRLDPLYYHQWGQRIAAGDWLGTSVFEMSPLYAYILGVLYTIFGDGTWTPQILQCVLAAIVCGLLAPVGRRTFGKAEGVVAGAAFAIYGPAIFYDGQVMKTSLEISFTSLMTFALFAASRGRDAPRPRWLFAGGVLLGLTALMRENILVAAPIFFVWALWPRRGRTWGKALVAAAALTAGTLLPILPFTVRNAVVGHELVLISSLGGENFYTGNNEIASGRYTPPPFVRPDPEYEHLDFRREAARRAGHPLTRREANDFWFREGLKFITGHPVRYAALLWDKLAVFFNDFERPDNYSYYNFARFASLLRGPVLHFVWIAPLGLLGIALSRRRWGSLAPLLITLAAFLASALIFFTQSRYRMPAVPLLCLFGAHAAVELVSSARAMRWTTLAWSIPALVVLTLFVRVDPGNTPLFDAQNEALVAEMYLEAGRLDEAVASYRRSLDDLDALPMAGMPALGRVKANAHLGLARTLLRKGDRAEGIAELRQAARSPRPEVRFNSLMLLGVLIGQDGDLGGAAEAFHRAVGENPDSFEARMMYAQALDRTGRRSEAISQVDEALRIRPQDAEAHRIRDALTRGGASR
ncbi:MAG TPA: glycosyltransferase family 39 protein, partial [Candidatus Saccharimonadales bacterium]|nr:glycosyltransferase family 39 protein [Candidatus Saccharimonadales bacterium]